MSRPILSLFAFLALSALCICPSNVSASNITIFDNLVEKYNATQVVPDPFDLVVAVNALYLCKAAYCAADAIEDWDCGIACKHGKLQDIAVYGNDSLDAQGFSGYDPTSNHIVISFRGSATIKNWIANLEFGLMAYPNLECVGCRVHHGFLSTYGSLLQQVTDNSIILLKKYPMTKKILVTGHSLGGAIAYLTAVQLNYQALTLARTAAIVSAVPMYVYTFGQPRVGNAEFNAWALAQFARSSSSFYRITHSRDPVPHLPPIAFGYLHAPGEIFYKDDSENNFVVCVDTLDDESDDCSDKYTLLPSISDHLLYLDVPTECSDSFTRIDVDTKDGDVRVQVTQS